MLAGEGAGGEDFVEGFELEEEGSGVCEGVLVGDFPGEGEVGAVDDAVGFGVAGGAVGEAFRGEGVCEGALAGVARVVGEANAGDEEDGGGVPGEEVVFEGGEAEAGGEAGVEGAEAVEEGGGFEEEGELAEKGEGEDFAFGLKGGFEGGGG